MSGPGRADLVLVGACSRPAAARDAARTLSADLYEDARPGRDDLPFRSLIVAVSDAVEVLADVADVGCYLALRRPVRTGTAAVFGLFPMIRRGDLSRARADAHWRDVHAPLALQHHAAMTRYIQLAVLRTLSGRAFDGFALCGFASEDDLRQRFFTTPDSPQVIRDDVRRFADVARSPRRLVATWVDGSATAAER